MQEADAIDRWSDKAHHYTALEDVPLHIQKYWKSRHKIFSYYNEGDGVYMTDDAWFGVTPEPVAAKIAADLPKPAGSETDGAGTVIDIFAGVGGNTIQFALSGRWQRVIGIERDRTTLACAQNNARVAGVPDGAITWVHADCFDTLARLKTGEPLALFEDDGDGGYAILDGDACSPAGTYHLDESDTVVFASPPWGGVGYTEAAVFDLSTMEPYSLHALHALCRPMAHALYLPRTSNLQQLADVYTARRKDAATADGAADAADQDEHPKLEVAQYCMHGFSKALVVFYPAEFEYGDTVE